MPAEVGVDVFPSWSTKALVPIRIGMTVRNDRGTVIVSDGSYKTIPAGRERQPETPDNGEGR